VAGLTVLRDEIRGLARASRQPAYLPASTYRLQLNKNFTFGQAAPLAAYLRDLGIDTLYCSPYLEATPGSLHGYDITNPLRLNPEIGTPEDYERFCGALCEKGLGQILDIVPNHMGIRGNTNTWWQDVLENGEASAHASFFDIDWNPPKAELAGKVLVPILEDHYGIVLEKGEIALHLEGGRLLLKYYDHEFPLDPSTYPFVLARGLEELHAGASVEDGVFSSFVEVLEALHKLRNKTSPEDRKARDAEKEKAKENLGALFRRSDALRGFAESRVGLFNGSKEDRRSFDLLDELIGRQHYRLAFWRVASEEINYRRFFTVNDLAAIRMEDPEVFDAYHASLFRWVSAKKLQGFRIDHPDGLYDPVAYFRGLQRHAFAQLAARDLQGAASEEELRAEALAVAREEEFAGLTPFFTVVEKILERGEKLPADWRIHGTVGYDFLNDLNGLFVQRENQKAVQEVYESFIGHPIRFNEASHDQKKFFATVSMASEVSSLGNRLDAISEKSRCFRDFTRASLTAAIGETIACFPVYRTYITPGDTAVSERDRKYIEIAVKKAKSRNPGMNPSVYDFLAKVLLLELGPGLPEEKLYRDFVLRFQQLTGPVMAKGVEDTALYIYNPLVSLNEVGGSPDSFGISVEEFHRHNAERQEQWPHGLIATSTHDTKRSEDVRMRINVLSEIPQEWKTQIERWAIVNEKHKTLIRDLLQPTRNTEYFIYQTMLGVWPDLADPNPNQVPENLRTRLEEYFLKSAREAGLYTSWMKPEAEYEEALKKFLCGILSGEKSGGFLGTFLEFQRKISAAGKLNSLSALVLKLGSPGAADFYQGTELWDYSLVDPDNRRPVDYDLRRALLSGVAEKTASSVTKEKILEEFLASKDDGRIKLYLLSQGLHFRRREPRLFSGGDYVPLEIAGERKKDAVAFLRRQGGARAVAAAGRFFSGTASDAPPAEFWKGTFVLLPQDNALRALTDIFSGRRVSPRPFQDKPAIELSQIFSPLPAALLSGPAANEPAG
jgi:(1->4)-alpha-D-glucan 1-alpha-D-glucosylmutase